MNYEIIRSKRKTLSIVVDHKGEVKVHAPNSVSGLYIDKFVENKKCWIDKKIDTAKCKEQMFESVLSMEQIMLCGCLHDIKLEECKLNAEFIDNCLIVGRFGTNAKIRQFLKKKSYDYCSARLDTISRSTNLCFDKLQISNSHRYWGLCTSNKLIKVNLRIIMLPWYLIDYILVHELCHTVYLNHSDCFWELVGRILPCYKQYRKELKLYSRFLELYRDSDCL